jgi:hypothetical protein
MGKRHGPGGGWAAHPNLRWSGSSWAKGNGRIQKGVRRAFLAAGTNTLTTSQVFDWTIVDRQAHWRRRERFTFCARLPTG